MRPTALSYPPPERTRGSAGRTIFLAQATRVAVRLGQAATLGRLLTPEAYGLHGMAATVFGFFYMARDFGIVTALQQTEVTPQRFNALFRLGVFGGAALALLGALVSVPTGWFFNEPTTVPSVLAAMCGAFLFSGAAAPAVGVLYREQRAGVVALLDAAATAAGSLAAIAAAWAGWGVWALVLMTLIQELVWCALVWGACPWRPGRDIQGTSWRAVIGFGLNLSGHNIATFCARILDHVTVGRTIGATALGLYGRGAQTTLLPAQFGLGPFTPWIVATLGAKRGSPADYTEFFQRALNGLLHVSFVSATVCLVVPELALRIVFGDQWTDAAPVARCLGIVLAIQPWLMAPVWLLSAQGEVRRLFAWSSIGVALVLAGCLSAFRLGPVAVALAAAVAASLHACLGVAFCGGRTPVAARVWAKAAVAPFLLHGGLAVVWIATTALIAMPQLSFARAAVLLGVSAAYYVAMLRLFPSLWADFRRHVFFAR